MLNTFRRISFASIGPVLILTGIFGCTGAVQANNKPGLKRPQKIVHSDLGMDTAMVKTQTILFANPDINSAKVNALCRGELTVLVSRDVWNGWLSIVQVSSGRQGWVRLNRLFNPIYTAHRNPDVTLQSISTGTIDAPILEVNNDSDNILYLHIDKLAEISIASHTTRSIVVQAGIFSFNAASPNVLPDFGHMAFLPGSRYLDRYTTYSAGHQKKPDLATLNVIAEYKRLLPEVEAGQAEEDLARRQNAVDGDALTKQSIKSKTEYNNLEVQRIQLDRLNSKAVDDFNLLVAVANNDADTCQNMEGSYNAKVEAFNDYHAVLKVKWDRLIVLQDIVNAPQGR